jgi:hypothetical protein
MDVRLFGPDNLFARYLIPWRACSVFVPAAYYFHHVIREQGKVLPPPRWVLLIPGTTR